MDRWAYVLWIDGGLKICRAMDKGWMDGCVNLLVDRWINRGIDGRMDGWLNGVGDRWRTEWND
jgi:hypothetical protein